MRYAEARYRLDDGDPVIYLYADGYFSLEGAEDFAAEIADAVRVARDTEAQRRRDLKCIIDAQPSE